MLVSSAFIPVADDEDRLMRETPLFRDRVIAERKGVAHLRDLKGTVTEMPLDTKLDVRGQFQGVHVLAPDGTRVDGEGGFDVRAISSLLERTSRFFADRPWPTLPEEKVAPRVSTRIEAPTGTLALRLDVRDLTVERGRAQGGVAWNLDYVWFNPEEQGWWFKPGTKVGESFPIDRRALERLARFHLFDSVWGVSFARDLVQSPAFEAKQLEVLEGRGTVTRSDPAGVAFEFVVHSRAAGPIAGHPRGIALTWQGRAVWDPVGKRIKAFDMVAVGHRWGPTSRLEFDLRKGVPQPTPIGFALRVIGDDPNERMPPMLISRYGWPGIAPLGKAPGK